jgi:PPOX class probable F420-dependent enzyme
VDVDEALEFIKSNHHGVIATTRSDGRTAMSPIACDVDPDGKVVVSTRETAMKVKHLARDPHVAICVINDGFFGEWVQVEGTAEIVHLPEAMEGLVDYYRRVAGEHPDWDDYRAAMERERRVLLRITVTRSGPNRSG